MLAYKRVAGSAAAQTSRGPSSRVTGLSPRVSRRKIVKCEAKKVALLGAGGGIGQPLSLLLKMNKLVTELSLYDIAGVTGVGADISHCNTPVKVSAFNGPEELEGALKGAELIIIPAGVPRKPGMTRDDLFNVNAGIVKALVEAASKHCPEAIIQLVTNPVNSTVPIAAEVMKKAGTHNPAKIMGVSTLDVVRANTFVAEAKKLDVKDVDVPVVGGHAGATILPLLSQATPPVSFTDAEKKMMTEKIQNAGTVVVEAKAGKGSATLSMAYAAARMAESTLMGLNGEPNIYECSYVQSDVVPDCPFFASKVLLGPGGVAKVLPLGNMDAFEQACFDAMLPELKASIQKGIDFANA
uniref:malate dehydrogenase n=2 Tax=Dunaliella tertiolecta TaxID=3047 RepID=A0A7S3VRQ4_DUNTE|mmetsp:Transcript_10498/g.28722  ORF Transcript_10498/g.28722 Transcript_10498/m.28722 type:complete len:354 (-) Transcript_10498:738-1799(-)